MPRCCSLLLLFTLLLARVRSEDALTAKEIFGQLFTEVLHNLTRDSLGDKEIQARLVITRVVAVADPAVGWGEGEEKHEIYAANFSYHLFYDLLLQGWKGGMMAPFQG